MTDLASPAACVALLAGALFTAAAIGALRAPGLWRAMMEELDRSPALRFLAALLELTLGALLLLVVPWRGGGTLALILALFGALAILEALVVAAFGDRYVHFWMRHMAGASRAWPMIALVVGLALLAAGASHLS